MYSLLSLIKKKRIFHSFNILCAKSANNKLIVKLSKFVTTDIQSTLKLTTLEEIYNNKK